MQLWDKGPKCFRDQNLSAQHDRNISGKKKTVVRLVLNDTVTHNARFYWSECYFDAWKDERMKRNNF